MSLQDCTISNIPRLVLRNTSGVFPPWRRSKMPSYITEAVVVRLAHLITRMETTPNIGTAIGAKWVLANLDRLNAQHVFWDYLNPFVGRLQEAVSNYEEYSGAIDENHFGKMIELAGYPPERVLFGAQIDNIGESAFGTPHREVASFISYRMWKQHFN